MESGPAAILGSKHDRNIPMPLSLHHHIWEFECDMTMIDDDDVCWLDWIGPRPRVGEGIGAVSSPISFATAFAPNASFLHFLPSSHFPVSSY